jgi:V8-like Glu-specific endopeptidase
MRSKVVFVVLLLSFIQLNSCGENNPLVTHQDKVRSSVIIGDLEWEEVSKLKQSSPEYKASRAVGDVSIPELFSRCTGFLISENVLITNEHCIPSDRFARGVNVTFDHVLGVPESSRAYYKCSDFIGNDELLDFALLKCEGDPGIKYGYLTLSEDEPIVNDGIYVIQQNCNHEDDPNCDWNKKIAFGGVVGLGVELIHNADTLSGSSGSPVFNQNHEVVGLHHAGAREPGTGKGIENYAIGSVSLVNYIRNNFPGILPDEDGVPWMDKEPNGKRRDAVEIPLLAEYELRGQISSRKDKDYYKIKVNKKQKVKVTLNFSHEEGDLNLYLHKKCFAISKSKSKTDNEQIEKVLKPGTYYIKVKGRRKAKAKYSILVEAVDVLNQVADL